ncbi:hypothetical protein [Thermodesulfatator atlanticus]|uniref:hypothetical protein n=1 Tax=Thermodesulfatator atlanticus TaxID=501497 RepID=UPI0003B72A42|nr:hypothetical protein [Thermodesulfatator atlanticus]
MSSLKKEEIEKALYSLLEQGAILGFEVPEDPGKGITIFAPKKDRSLEKKLEKILKGAPLRFIETEPPEAL